MVHATKTNLESWLRDYVDIVFANEDEARAFCGTDSPEAALDTFGELCDTAAVKLGADGAWLQSGSERIFTEAVKVEEVVDTTGAGDCWAAGFLYGYLKGLSLEKSGALAALVGAETVRTLGASPSPEGWKRIRAFVDSL